MDTLPIRKESGRAGKQGDTEQPQGSSQALDLIRGFTEDYFCLLKNFTYLGIQSLGVSFLSDLSTMFFFLIPSGIPSRASLMAQLIKNLLAMQETPV